MRRPEFDLLVIGGGAGGLVVAAGGAALGAKVALVEKGRLGGDCLWHGCVPSKTLLKSAHVAHAMRSADRFGLDPRDPAPRLARVMEHVAEVVAGIAAHDSIERFRSLGIDVIEGEGRFVSPDAFSVAGRTLTAKRFVVATGSRPSIPHIDGLDRTPYLTNETVFALREDVAHLVVVGAGAVGCELAQAFRRLGSDVTVVDVAPWILASEDRDLADVVASALEHDNVRFRLGTSIRRIEGSTGDLRLVLGGNGDDRLHASHLLIAAGRTPNVDGLDLPRAGVELRDGRIVHDGIRTANARIFAIGDAIGGGFTHVAEHHAAIVLRSAIFRQRWARISSVVPRCTFTDPELAQVGPTEVEARAHRDDVRAFVVPFEEIDRARTDVESAGFAKMLVDGRGHLLGAGVVGPSAGELISEFALAIGKRMKASDLSATVHPYPTLSQIVRRVADRQRNARLTPGTRALVRRVFRLRGEAP